VSWFLAFAGFSLLVIFHEAGHFAAAKAVGMRVERFSLFFPPLLLRKKIGETEYAIGALPVGGYVKITGMNPAEDLPDEVRTRAYTAQPVWKRVVVIAAGPAVNFVLGLLLLFVFFWQLGPREEVVGPFAKGFPAEHVLKKGDKVISIDGHGGSTSDFVKQVATHKCAQSPPVDRCQAKTPATLVIERNGVRQTIKVRPVYDAKQTKQPRLGFTYAPDGPRQGLSAGKAASTSLDRFWFITRETVKLPVRLFDPAYRKNVSGVVGSYETTRQTILHDPGDVVGVLAIISLSLAVINLFPFLPLDGGHIFWSLTEKVRGRPVPFSVMERSGFIGFALVLMLFIIGLNNDIGRITSGQGFGVH
jgi:regulator of sigma E protease